MCDVIRIAGTVNDSITDGPGLRFVVFVQGCPRRCEGCHNPSALDFDGGRDITVEELVKMASKNPLLSGVTISGGEPFGQAKALIPFVKAVKEIHLDVAVYTGYTFEELTSLEDPNVMELLKLTDTLVDGPFEKDKRDYLAKFKGSSNQRIIDVGRSIKEGSVILDVSERWT